jgi:hypothetical protein
VSRLSGARTPTLKKKNVYLIKFGRSLPTNIKVGMTAKKPVKVKLKTAYPKDINLVPAFNMLKVRG